MVSLKQYLDLFKNLANYTPLAWTSLFKIISHFILLLDGKNRELIKKSGGSFSSDDDVFI